MIDRPDASQLLRAMADTLTNQVLPATPGAAGHSVRVVANLCRILEREVQLGENAKEATRRDLGDLLEREGTLEELVAALDDRLRTHESRPEPDSDSENARGDEFADETDERFEARAHEYLVGDVKRRLSIDRPGYDT